MIRRSSFSLINILSKVQNQEIPKTCSFFSELIPKVQLKSPSCTTCWQLPSFTRNMWSNRDTCQSNRKFHEQQTSKEFSSRLYVWTTSWIKLYRVQNGRSAHKKAHLLRDTLWKHLVSACPPCSAESFTVIIKNSIFLVRLVLKLLVNNKPRLLLSSSWILPH